MKRDPKGNQAQIWQRENKQNASLTPNSKTKIFSSKSSIFENKNSFHRTPFTQRLTISIIIQQTF